MNISSGKYMATRTLKALTLLVLLTTGALISPLAAFAAFDWQAGPWGIVIDTNESPGSVFCPIDYPSGTKTGHALAVYYQLEPTNIPHLWVFLTDGFWRQTSSESQFMTSYRLFRYYSSGNEDCDTLTAVRFQILGTNGTGELEIITVYSNNAAIGDQFRVTGNIVLEKPDILQSAMRAEVAISNASSREVTNAWPGHRALAEQWEIFGVSSMYVADHLTGGLPPWYNGLDPAFSYVGITNDTSYLNDGFSVNGTINVSTHDTKFIVISNLTVSLNHETNLCPVIVIPEYAWYTQLVMLGQVATEVRVQHAYQSSRNHGVQILGCSGLTSIATNLKWAATYNRVDANLVDGDNIQIKLGLDEFLNAWPEDAIQTLHLRLTTGNTRPAIISLEMSSTNSLTIEWTTEPGESYNLEYTPTLGATWSNLTANVSGPSLGPQPIPPGFLRIAETNAP